jgi:hypothetical protein
VEFVYGCSICEENMWQRGEDILEIFKKSMILLRSCKDKDESENRRIGESESGRPEIRDKRSEKSARN